MNIEGLKQKCEILEKELKAEEFVLGEMALLGRVKNLDECNATLNRLLKDVGEFTKADRAYIVDENNGFYNNTFEWCRSGVTSVKDDLQGLTLADMPYWIPKLSEGESVLIENIEDVKEIMPVEYEILKPQAINTLIVFPILLANKLRGFIGVDNPAIKESRVIIRLLSALGGYLGIMRENSNIYAELEYGLNYDKLTGAYNRQGFYEQAQNLIKRDVNTEYCLIVSDIRSFKLINEIYGYDIADQILVEQVDMYKKQVGDKGIVGRLDGDVLAMVAPIASMTNDKIKRIVDILSDKYSNHTFKLRESVGIYYIFDRNEKIRVMVDKVRGTILKNKEDQNLFIVYYDDEQHTKDLLWQTYIGEFDTALKENQFVMYLQPQTDKHGSMMGAEALVRWNRPAEGTLMPGAFVECFEESGLIYRLDHYVWKAAAQRLKIWIEQGCSCYISVNISVKDFYYMDVYQTFMDLIQEYGIDIEKLHIEITETAFSENELLTHAAIKKLHDAGFVIEIDDFGSGYSTFNLLKDVCADVIKIDKIFLRESIHEKRSEQILQAVIRLSHGIGMEVISEGVETQNHIDMLADMNCDCYQGFYFSEPIPVEEFEKKYKIL